MNIATRDILVIDLEATCDDGGKVPRREMEIIEIGAVLVNGETLVPIAEFQTFVQPIRHPTLTQFCKQLTSITQAQVDSAPLFPKALQSLERFMLDHRDGGIPQRFGSWGAYDLHQFQQDARLHNLALPFAGDHLNIKKAFSAQLGTRKKFGMAGALRHVGIPLKGTHHRGIDDARNIAKLLPHTLLGHK